MLTIFAAQLTIYNLKKYVGTLVQVVNDRMGRGMGELGKNKRERKGINLERPMSFGIVDECNNLIEAEAPSPYHNLNNFTFLLPPFSVSSIPTSQKEGERSCRMHP